MWFLSADKPRPATTALSRRSTFCPRLEALEDRCLLSAGTLDPTFGSGGEVLTSIAGAANAYGNAVVAQPDGKIVVGGYISDFAGTTQSQEFALVRYNGDGTLDMTFGNKGVVETKVGNSGSNINGLALQSDGKIVAVGWAEFSTRPYIDEEFAVARYNPNGTLDTTFGAGKTGIVLTNVTTASKKVNGTDQAQAVAVQGDGKIVVSGFAATGTSSPPLHFALVRYTTTGALDASFGNSGIVVDQSANVGGPGSELAIQSDGKILVVGTAFPDNSMVAERYTTNGQLDTAFNGAGIVGVAAPSPYTNTQCGGILVQSDGTIILAGRAYDVVGGINYGDSVILARLTTGGALDNSFGSSGLIINSIMPGVRDIAYGANRDLVAGGIVRDANNHAQLALAAFLPNGALDTTFGTNTPPNGISIVNFSGQTSVYAAAMTVQGDGKIVATSQAFNSGSGVHSIGLARFLPPDTKIFSFTATQSASGSPVNLTASTIMDSNPSATITQVAFYYLDSNNNPLPVGYGTQSNGVWSLSATLTTGSYTFFAVAQDNTGALSDPSAAMTLTVQ